MAAAAQENKTQGSEAAHLAHAAKDSEDQMTKEMDRGEENTFGPRGGALRPAKSRRSQQGESPG